MQDGAIRRLIKRIARACYALDLAVARGLKGPPRYRLGGTCNGCGRCCEQPAVRTNPLFFRVQPFRGLFLAWQRCVNGFVYAGEDRRLHTFLFRCTHYDAATKRCDSYDSRPGMCRDYPRNLMYDAPPVLFPECSHVPVDRNAEQLRRSLERLSLPQEKLDELYQKLYLKE